MTQSLFYATDFVDRLENEIVPALRAGFIVLTDRYIYSLMARAIVRGMDPNWIRSIFAVALEAGRHLLFACWNRTTGPESSFLAGL